jgi:hypothetical protein
MSCSTASFGLLNRDEHRNAEARKNFEEALAIYRALAAGAPATYQQRVQQVEQNRRGHRLRLVQVVWALPRQGAWRNPGAERGGPVVVMLVVVMLGVHLRPAPAQRFDVTAFLHGKPGHQAVILRNHGKVSLDLGADKRIEAVGDKGEVRFAGIPDDLRGREVGLGLEDDTYELVKPELTIRLDQEAVYVAIQPRQLVLVGYVSDEHGPLPQARAVIAKATAVTDQDGRFEITLPADLPEGDPSITITAAGHEPWRGQAVPGGGPLRVQLSPSSGGK